MTTHNTGNAVPSVDVKDLFDNCETEDIFCNGDADTTITRTGKTIKTMDGMNAAFNDFLIASGFEPNHLIYVNGSPLQVDRPTQLIDRAGSVYRVKMPATFPVMLTGTWATDQNLLVDVGDISLRQALALSSGAGMIGFDTTLSYPANTLGLAIKGRRSVYQFGAIVPGGVTNNYATLLAACNAGAGVYDARNLGTIRIDGSLPLKTDQFWDFAGTKIVTANTAQDVFFIDQTDNTVLVRPHITGPGGATFSGGSGVHINDATNYKVIDPTVINMPGYGIYTSPGSNTSNRGEHGVITNPRIKGCNIGIKDTAGTGAEYYTITNPHINACYEAALAISAGNVVILGGHVIDNVKTALYLGGGSNQGHGIIQGVNFNHNGIWNLEAHDVVNGQSIVNCHFYASNNAGAGAIWLDRCKGIDINGGVLEGWIYNYQDANSGMNMIRNMYCPGDYGLVTLTPGANNGLYQLWVTECYGPGAVAPATGISINDPGIVNVKVVRAPGTTQAISGSTQLIYPTEDYDRRLAYNNATGLFTVPAGQAGRYVIQGGTVFSGTAMTASSSYVEVKVGSTLVDFSPCVPFSTTKLVAKFFTEVNLIAGDTVAIMASISGTTPVFGDASYRSTLSINRIG